MSQSTKTSFRPDEPLVSPTELAAFLGVPVATIYQYRYRGEGPPGFKVGGHVRYRWHDVEAWLHRHSDSAR